MSACVPEKVIVASLSPSPAANVSPAVPLSVSTPCWALSVTVKLAVSASNTEIADCPVKVSACPAVAVAVSGPKLIGARLAGIVTTMGSCSTVGGVPGTVGGVMTVTVAVIWCGGALSPL